MTYIHKMNMCQKIHSTHFLLRDLVRWLDDFKELSMCSPFNKC